MAFDESVFGGGSTLDQIATDLASHYQPADGAPFSSDPSELQRRLARKLMQPSQYEDIDFTPTKKQAKPEKAPDLSAFGDKLPEVSTDDLSSFGDPVKDAPAPDTLSDYPKEFGKGVVRGAKDMGASALKGAAALGIPNPADMGLIDELANAGSMSASERAKLMGRALRGISDRGIQMDYNAALQRIARGADAQAEAQALREKFGKNNAVAAEPVTEKPLYKAGKAVEEYGKETLAPKPGWENSWTADLGQGAGSMAAGVGLSMIPYVGPIAAGATFTLAGSGEAVDNAVKGKATPQQTREAAMFGGVAGATDMVDALLPMLGSTGRALGFLKRVGIAAAKGALMEGGQEGLQQLMQNAIAKGIYKPDQDWFEDVPRSMAVAAILGGVGGGISGVAHRNEQPSRSSPEEIDEFLRQREAREAASAPSSPPGTPPVSPQSPTGTASTEQAEVEGLKRYGWSDEEIASMSPAQRRAEFQEAMETGQSEPPQSKPEGNGNAADTAMQGLTDLFAGTRDEPIKATTAEDVAKAQPVEPKSGAQAQAENYQHSHLEIDHLGLAGKNSISVETGSGQVRKGVDADGKPWEVTMPVAYGRIKGTKGADGQPLDIFVGPNPTSQHVFILNQHDPKTGNWDEHKILAGFSTPQDALRAYASAFEDSGKDRIGGMVAMTPERFRGWIKNGEHTQPAEHVNGSKDESGTARSLSHAGISSVAERQGSMPESEQPGGAQLQRTRNQHGAGVGRLPDVSGSGRAEAESGAHAGADQERQGVRTRQRALGDEARASQQPAQERESDRSGQNAIDRRMGARSGSGTLNNPLPDQSGRDVPRGRGPDAEPRGKIKSHLSEQEIGNIFDEIVGTASAEKGGEPGIGDEPASGSPQLPQALSDGGPSSETAGEESRGGEVLAPGRVQAEADDDHYAQIEAVLGADYHHVLPVDIVRAAEILAENPAITPQVAFQYAVIENAAAQKLLTFEDLEQVYGPEVKAVLDAESVDAHQSGRAVEGESTTAEEAGGDGAAQAGELPGGGETGATRQDQEQHDAGRTKSNSKRKARGRTNEADDGDQGTKDADHAEVEGNDPRLTSNERTALQFVLKGKNRWHRDSPMAVSPRTIMERGRTEGDDEVKVLESALAAHHRHTNPDEYKPKAAQPKTLDQAFYEHFAKGEGFGNILAARRLAKEFNLENDPKVIEEAIEFAVVRRARDIIGAEVKPYPALVNLYASQPKLGTRTSTSVRDQAYSTPVPLGYLAQRLAGVTDKSWVLEPTAGNGALLTTANPEHVYANEINAERRKNLEAQGYKVFDTDAAIPEFGVQGAIARNVFGAGIDVVLANPPFGPVKDGSGNSRVFDMARIQPGYKTTEIDHVIAINALAAMKDDGRAVLILGGLNKQLQTKEKRSDGYNGKAKREFYKVLYDNYNVTDHFTVAGELYERQGAGWPVDVVVINGRGKSARAFPAVDVPRIYDSWESLGGLLDEQAGSADVGAVERPDGAPARETRRRLEGNRPTDRADARRRGPASRNEDERANGVRGEPVSGQHTHAGVGGTGDQVPVRPGAGRRANRSDQQSPAVEPASRLSADEIGDIFDELVDERTTGEVATSAANNATSAADEALSGLTTLFGGGKTIGSGLNFDEETYAKAKPMFIAASEKFADFRHDIRELMKRMLDHLKSAYAWTTDTLRNARPYIVRFIQDVQDGVVNLGKPAEQKAAKRPSGATEAEGQAVYKPQSKVPGLDTLVPINMQRSIEESLDALEARVGPIDEFVAKELQWTPEQLEEYLGAEQVDAVGLAIDNLKRGNGFIIGDQTGIGKGRVNATIIRWALLNDRIPIFTTMMPDLYADIYRDMRDIGMEAPRMLATNTSLSLPLDETGAVTIKTGDSKKHGALLEKLADPTEFKKHYDMVLTTYAQTQTVKGKDTQRRKFLQGIIKKSTILFDESHNAGGQAGERKAKGIAMGRSDFARDLVTKANGVFYSSATYAKRPDVMDLYAATDMAMAVEHLEDLGEAIASGGIPMQQAVAAMLAKSGQYIRRERSFAGIDYNTPLVEVDHEAYDGISYALAAIQDFSAHVKEVAREVADDLKSQGEALGYDNATGEPGAQSTNFTSIMHNIINQMLLAMKAPAAAKMAIERIQRGEKPVLTVANTMEAFLKDYVNELDIKVGDEIDADFSDVLMKYLDRSRRITIRKPFGKASERHVLTDGELGREGVEAYNAAKAQIASLNLSHLPVSPIDYLKAELQKAGYQVGEITGRSLIIDYTGDKPVLRTRPSGEISTKGKNDTRRKFNSRPENGGSDAIVINQSGSTGVSMHASKTFDDKRQRRMIIVQPEANIDTHMQLLGRVNRTGQVALPGYDQLVADIPAEKRPAAVLAKKMASLNANTTAARSSAVTAKDVPDFINEYGDRVAVNYLSDNLELNERLALPIKPDQGGKLNTEDAMRKVTGRIPLLPLAEQEELYQYLEEEYAALIKQLEASGASPLEAKTIDLKARRLETTEVQGPKNNSGSPFAAPVNVDKVSVLRQGKPFKPAELMSRLSKAVGGTEFEEDKHDTATLGNMLADFGQSYQSWGRSVREIEMAERKAKRKEFDAYVRPLIDKLSDAKEQEAENAKYMAIKERWTALHQMLPIGARVRLNMFDANPVAVVLGVKQTGKTKNPLALGSWKVDFAIADATRQMQIPFSRLYEQGKADDTSLLDIEVVPTNETARDTLARFELMQSGAREDRYIASGNILAAYDWLNMKGAIINYTDEKGAVHQGIMTPKDFDIGKHAINKGRVVSDVAEIKTLLDQFQTVWSKDRQANLSRADRWSDNYQIQVEKKKATGGRYYLDPELTKLTGDFYSRGGMMSATVSGKNLPAAIVRMQEIGASFTVAAAAPKAQKIEHEGPPPDDEPPGGGSTLAARKEATKSNGFTISRRSNSLAGAELDVPDLLSALQLAHGRFYANYAAIAEKHPEAFKSPEDARNHIEEVLSSPDFAIPHRTGNIDLIKREGSDRLVGFRARVKNGRYNIATAYVLDPGQFDRMKNGAAHAGATVKALNAKGHWSGQGRKEDNSGSDLAAQAAAVSPLTRESQRLRGQIEQRLREIVGRVAGPGVTVEFRDGLIPVGSTQGYTADTTPQAAGTYTLGDDLIRLAYLPAQWQMMDNSAYHESYHHLEARLLSEQERKLMEAETPRLREWIKGKTKLRNDQVDGLAGYEVRAIAFQTYAHERGNGQQQAGAGIHIMIRRWFDRLMEGLRALAHALRGFGFKTYGDIFNSAYTGEFAGRAPSESVNINPNVMAARWDIFHRRQDELVTQRVRDAVLSSTAAERVQEKVQNFNAGVKRLEDAVEARMDGELPDSKAFYQKKRLFPGKVATDVQDFNKQHLDPLIDMLKARGITLDKAGDILYAQHAAERNAYIDTINPDLNGKGSGMSNEEAHAILERFDARDLAEVARRADAIRDFITDTMVNAGLESRPTVEAWQRQYEHYVPLSGFEEMTDDDDVGPREPGSFKVRGREVKTAFGRRSKANNPLVNLLDQAYRTIERARKNEYLRSLKLALSGLEPEERKGFVQFDRGKMKPEIDPRTGLVRYVPDSTFRFSPKAVPYKIGGHTHYMVFEKEAIAETMRRMHPNALAGVFQNLLVIQNKLKAMWTHYSPEFLIRHFIFRYPIEGTINSFEQGPSNVPRYMADSIPFLGRASKAIFASNKGEVHDDPDVAQYQRYWDEMRKAGGAMAFRQARDIDLLREHLDKKLMSISGRPLASARAKWQAGVEAMDVVTNALDNSLRLAAYATARRQGRTPEQAAVIARDATVDFQMAGQWKHALGLIWPFLNVAVQTGARMTSAVARSKIMRRVFGGTVLAGFLAGMFNYLVGGDDKDGIAYYDKLAEYDKHLNIIVLNPFNRDEKGRPIPIKIPLPYNWAFPFALGQTLATMAFTKTKGAVKHMLAMSTKAAIEAFGPFAEDANWVANISPELLKPLVHTYTNQNWTGYPIHKDPAYQKGPRSESGFKNTGEGWKYSARMLNTMSGGDKRHSGYIDMFPEDLRELVDYYSGLGTQRKFVQRGIETGEEGLWKNIDKGKAPLTRVFMGTDYDAADRSMKKERSRAKKRPWEH